MSAAKSPTKRVRAKRRAVPFVRPQLLHHEALAVIDYMRATLATAPESVELMAVRSGLDEIVRATAEAS